MTNTLYLYPKHFLRRGTQSEMFDFIVAFLWITREKKQQAMEIYDGEIAAIEQIKRNNNNIY